MHVDVDGLSRYMTSSNQKTIRGAGYALALLVLINLFNYIDRYVLSAAVGPIKETFFGEGRGAVGSDSLTAIISWFQHRLGFKPDDALLGLLGTAFMVIYMVGAPVFGRLASRRSRWGIVALGVILWSLASGASGLASTFFMLLLTRCFVGIGEAAYGPVAPDMISDMYPIESRGRVMAWFYAATPVGSALGYMLGGLVINSGIGGWSARNFGTAGESWRWAFFIVTLPGIILGLWCLFMKEPRREGLGSESKKAIPWRQYRVLLRTPSYILCTLGMTAMTFAIGGMSFWMPYYLESKPGASSNSTIIFGGILLISGIVATLLGGMAGDKLRTRFPGSYFLVSGTAMMIGFPIFLAALHAPFPWAIWIMMFLACFCLFFNTGPTNTILANVTHPSIRSVGFAINIFIIHAFGDVISPVIIGLLNDWLGDMNKSFLVVGLMFLAAGIFWLLGVRYLKRDTEAALEKL